MVHLKEFLSTVPWWYWIITGSLSVYYSTRGIIEQKVRLDADFNSYTKSQRFIIFYIQEALFKTVVTVSSFISLYVSAYLFPSITEMNDMSAGKAILMIFLIIWGITGVCGYLTLFIASGKIPGIK